MKFKIGDRVMINELNIIGHITLIEISKRGIAYEVRYFWNSEGKVAYFYEDELTLKSDVKIHMEFIKPSLSQGADHIGLGSNY